MMMDNDFPLMAAKTTDPRSPRDEFVPQDWQRKLFPRQPEDQKPGEQGPVKKADGLGYLQEYVAGMNQYQQAGTDVPDFGVRSDYAQEQGGPLVSRTIRYSPPNAIIKAPALDSPYMDQLIDRGFEPLPAPRPRGPQLPVFKQAEAGFGGQEVAMTEKDEDKMLLRSLQRGDMGSGRNVDKAIQDLINKINGVRVRGV